MKRILATTVNIIFVLTSMVWIIPMILHLIITDEEARRNFVSEYFWRPK